MAGCVSDALMKKTPLPVKTHHQGQVPHFAAPAAESATQRLTCMAMEGPAAVDRDQAVDFHKSESDVCHDEGYKLLQ